MRGLGLLRLALAFCLLLAGPAAAQVRVTFYGHEWNAGGDRLYPHAFIRVTGQPQGAAAPIDEVYGFTTLDQLLAPIRSPGAVVGADAAYISRSTPYFWIEISDADYGALHARIDTWSHPPGSYYNLHKHNCIVFAADMARQLGLTVGDITTLKPAVFMGELVQLNAGKIALGAAPPYGPPMQATAEPAVTPLNP